MGRQLRPFPSDKGLVVPTFQPSKNPASASSSMRSAFRPSWADASAGEALWYIGRLPDAADRRLAVVGARDASMARCARARIAAASAAPEWIRDRVGRRPRDRRGRASRRARRRAARRSPFSAVASTSSIPIATPRCTRTSPRAALISEYAPGRRRAPASSRRATGSSPRWPRRSLVVEAGLARARDHGALREGARAAPARRSREPRHRRLIAIGRRAAVADARGFCAARWRARHRRLRPVPARFAPLMAALRRAELPTADLARRLGWPLGRHAGPGRGGGARRWLCRRPGGALASMEDARGN